MREPRQVSRQRLGAVMNVYGITCLLTFNKPDFKRFGDFDVISTAEVICQSYDASGWPISP